MEIKSGVRAFGRKVINPRVIGRWKLMMFGFALCFGVAQAVELGKYVSYDSEDVIVMGKGQIVEYSNDDEFCRSWILPPGFSLMHWVILAIIYFFVLCYLFLGIAIISDIFML